MKRILCFLLVIFVMASIAVPAFATDTAIYKYGDVIAEDIYTVWDSNVYPYAVISVNDENVAYMTMFKEYKWADEDGVYFYTPSKIYKLNGSFGWEYVNAINEQDYRSSNNLTWVSQNFSHNGTLYYTHVPPIIASCDGSTCPATDVNFDNICDECGMPLAYNLRVTPRTYEFVIKHSDELTLKYTYTETLAGTVMNAVYSDDRVTVSFDNPVNHYQYKLVGDEWEEYASYPNTYGSHAMSLSETATILSSNLIVYDENGDVFFRNPLWMVMGQVVQGEMKNLTAETGGTMKVLTLCGVGLIALLVVLSLFGKRSLISLR